jgi:hypothetical protein
MCSIAEDSHVQCEIPGFSHRNWNNVDYGDKFQEHFKKNNKDMSFDFRKIGIILNKKIIFGLFMATSFRVLPV